MAIIVMAIILFTAPSIIPAGVEYLSKSSWPTADGTFIQAFLVKDWSDDKWLSELQYLKDVGMHYVILQTTADRSNGGKLMTIYPTSLTGCEMYDGYYDVVDACLRNAKKMGFKVFLGLNFDNGWWKKYAWDPVWLYDRMEEGNLIADELYDLYHKKYSSTFYGWYWPWEIDNLNFKWSGTQKAVANAININLQHLQTTNRRLPFMISPFMNSRYGSFVEYKNIWTNILANTDLGSGDILCPQDSVGTGGVSTNAVSDWFSSLRQAVNTRPGLLLWSDAEIFDHENLNSTTLDRFIMQLKDVQPYVDNIVTFAYSHYYSPNISGYGFHSSYLYYVMNGMLESTTPESPSNLKKEQLKNGDISLTWNAPKDYSKLCGYLIYRDGKLLERIQVQRALTGIIGQIPSASFIDKSKNKSITCKYDVKTYDFSGSISLEVN